MVNPYVNPTCDEELEAYAQERYKTMSLFNDLLDYMSTRFRILMCTSTDNNYCLFVGAASFIPSACLIHVVRQRGSNFRPSLMIVSLMRVVVITQN